MKNGFGIFTKMLVSFLILFLLCFAVFSFVTKARDIYDLDKNVAVTQSFEKELSKAISSSGDDAFEFLQTWLIINDW